MVERFVCTDCIMIALTRNSHDLFLERGKCYVCNRERRQGAYFMSGEINEKSIAFYKEHNPNVWSDVP